MSWRPSARSALLLGFVFLSAGLKTAPLRSQVTDTQISEQLRLTLESAPVPLELSLSEEPLLATLALPRFYERRTYLPAWVGSNGPRSEAYDLLEFMVSVDRDGLLPADYHAVRIRELLEGPAERPQTSGDLVELDILLTDAFLLLGAHLVSGRVDPTSLDREWQAVRREVDLLEALDSALGDRNVQGVLSSLLPDHPGYRRLRERGAELAVVVEAGGWPSVSPGPLLELGVGSGRVLELKRRLFHADPSILESAAVESEVFDERLQAAVQTFQRRHGLDPDGVVGDKTVAALNVSAADRLRQIYLNLERWRWLPQSLGERYVLVNLPAFDLRAIEGNETQLEMRVAVGKPFRRTPVFSDVIRYLVFNPFWEVPASIAARDKLPEIRKDPSYLARQGMRVYRGWGTEQTQVDPTTIDWAALSGSNFPYRLRQDPGPLNALGRVKFMFPNQFSIYLHDTPGREVFNRADRDVSSGCIRLQKPLELAELLLRPNSDWRPGALQEVLSDYRERTVRLSSPWPVHILHWTAWVDDDLTLQFRPDLYGRDEKLALALTGSLPPG